MPKPFNVILPFQGVPDDDQEQGSRDGVHQVGELPVVDFTAASGVVGQVGPSDIRRQPDVLLPEETGVRAHDDGQLRGSSN